MDSFKPRAFLAFDHRRLFERWLTQSQIPVDEHYAKVVKIKNIIYTAATAVTRNVEGNNAEIGILVDEQYAASIVLNAKSDGIAVALAVERNQAPNFTLEYGEDWHHHVSALSPNYIKVLIRWSHDPKKNSLSIELLKKVYLWSRKNNFELLLELIAEEDRNTLIIPAIEQISEHKIIPKFWKIPIPQSSAEAMQTVDAARHADGEIPEIFLLGGARSSVEAREQIQPFLSIPGIAGWAVGRAIWGEAAQQYISGLIEEPECLKIIISELTEFSRLS